VYKKLQGDAVEYVAFGKGQRFSDKPRQTLPQGVVSAFDIGCLSGFLPAAAWFFPKKTPWVAITMAGIKIQGCATR